MADLAWAALCDASAVDTDSNRASLFHITERLVIREGIREQIEKAAEEAQAHGKTPLLPADYQLFQWWVRTNPSDSETVTAQIVLESPSGHTAPLFKHTMDFAGGFGYRWRTMFSALPFRGWGVYWFCVYQFAGDEHDLEAPSTQRVARVPLLLLPPDSAVELDELEQPASRETAPANPATPKSPGKQPRKKSLSERKAATAGAAGATPADAAGTSRRGR